MEQSKWQKELAVYDRLVNTIVLTGNVGDYFPMINEAENRIEGYDTLEPYLVKSCLGMGYKGVVCYDPVKGFSSLQIRGTEQPENVIDELLRVVNQANKDAGEGDNAVQLRKRTEQDGRVTLEASDFENAAHAVDLLLTESAFPVAVIMRFSSRLVARPDDLVLEERMTFMHLQSGAVDAKVQGGLRNMLYLIADKLNDLPAWYTLYHSSLKNINIPKPDYLLRTAIIETQSKSGIPGYAAAGEEEKKNYLDTFVGTSEGFTVKDLVRVFQLVRNHNLDMSQIDKAILLYKHGVQDNPWMKVDAERLANAEETIRRRVLGQDQVIKKSVDILKRAAMGMSGLQHSGNSSKPRGILFLAGPTGTGKTELAKALTELIFMDERNMIRFDMSEYHQEQSDQRLLGAPPGYVGYEAGGQLTNAVREHPFSVLLFDEIEKADKTILDKFLQILEDGRITDGRGDTVYFQDCLIIFTSNLGMTKPSPENPQRRIPNVEYEKDTDYAVVKEKIMQGVKDYFNEELGRPELLNRIGNNVLVFNYIREDSVEKILEKQIRNIANHLFAEKRVLLDMRPSAKEDLLRYAVADLPKGLGGRGVGNLVEEMLLNPLAAFMFDQSIKTDATVAVEHILKQGDNVTIQAQRV